VFPRRDPPLIDWPDQKAFAFTIFDDPDAQTYEDGRLVYSFLADLGFRTTRGVWPGPVVRTPNSGGETCENLKYRQHSIELQRLGGRTRAACRRQAQQRHHKRAAPAISHWQELSYSE